MLPPATAFAIGCLDNEKLSADELAALRWEDVDLREGVVHLGRRRRLTPLTAWAVAGEPQQEGLVLAPHARGPVAALKRDVKRGTRGAAVLEDFRGRASGTWAERAHAALTLFADLDDGEQSAHALAFAAGAAARLEGWEAERSKRYLAALLATRNPDGGFGLGFPFDPFKVGRPNPANRTYTVTVAGHAGRVLLEAHSAGAVGLDEIDRLVRILLEAPRARVDCGQCVGYSTRKADARRCVNNVNASVGVFLSGARRAGSEVPGTDGLIAEIARCLAAHYVPEQGGWAYAEGRRRLNDFNHEAATIEGAIMLVPPLGTVAAARFMRRRDYARWTDPLGQIRLLSDFPSHRSHFLGVFDAMIGHQRLTARLSAQFAYWASRLAADDDHDG